MFGNHFYHKTTKHAVYAFGSLFNNLDVARYNGSGTEVERIKVPVHYGPKEKYLVRLRQDANLETQVAITLPIISFEMTGLSYDSQRKRNRKHVTQKTIDSETRSRVFEGVPYRLQFKMSIMVAKSEDGTQILEQILPYFTPSFNAEIRALPELDLEDDFHVVLKNVQNNDSYEGEFSQRRAIIWELDFEVYIWYYGHTKDQGVIKKAQVDILPVSGEGPVTNKEIIETPRVARITTTPDPITASADDAFGFNEVLEEFNDGLKYDPVDGDDKEPPI